MRLIPETSRENGRTMSYRAAAKLTGKEDIEKTLADMLERLNKLDIESFME
jgi:hypothetical protein